MDCDQGFFNLVVKRYPWGKMSNMLFDMKPGDTLDFKGPLLNIEYSPNMKKSLGLMAGGSGITPMIQLIQKILNNPGDKTQVTLVFANVSEWDILLRNHINILAKDPRLRVHYVLENPPDQWSGSIGLINEGIISKFMPPPSDDSMVMVCGPPGMLNAICGEREPDFSQGPIDGMMSRLGYNSRHLWKL